MTSEKVPNCPYCGHGRCYRIKTRDILKCAKCHRQYRMKSAGPYRHSKLPLEKIEEIRRSIKASEKLNIAQIARDHGLSYRGAYYIVDKLRKIPEDTP